MSTELAALAETIGDEIARHGFFILLDERLQMICGRGPLSAEKVEAFASAHGWSVHVEGEAVVFSRPKTQLFQNLLPPDGT